MTKWEWPSFLRTRAGKWALRVTLVVLVAIFLLVAAYLAASKKPGFYHRFESTSATERRSLNDEFLKATLASYSDIQKSGKWSLCVTDRQLNGWLSTDGPSALRGALPREIKSPRVAINGRQIDIAAPVSYQSYSATAHVTGTISVPEPGVVALRFRSAKLGVYPFDKAKLVDMIKGSLDKPDWQLEQLDEGGDPVLRFRPKIVIEKKFELIIESFETDDEGKCLITGSVAKVKRR